MFDVEVKNVWTASSTSRNAAMGSMYLGGGEGSGVPGTEVYSKTWV